MVSPTKSGRMVERRDQVLIGRLSFAARAVSTFCTRWWSTNGPFLTERAIYPVLICRGGYARLTFGSRWCDGSCYPFLGCPPGSPGRDPSGGSPRPLPAE